MGVPGRPRARGDERDRRDRVQLDLGDEYFGVVTVDDGVVGWGTTRLDPTGTWCAATCTSSPTARTCPTCSPRSRRARSTGLDDPGRHLAARRRAQVGIVDRTPYEQHARHRHPYGYRRDRRGESRSSRVRDAVTGGRPDEAATSRSRRSILVAAAFVGAALRCPRSRSRATRSSRRRSSTDRAVSTAGRGPRPQSSTATRRLPRRPGDQPPTGSATTEGVWLVDRCDRSDRSSASRRRTARSRIGELAVHVERSPRRRGPRRRVARAGPAVGGVVRLRAAPLGCSRARMRPHAVVRFATGFQVRLDSAIDLHVRSHRARARVVGHASSEPGLVVAVTALRGWLRANALGAGRARGARHRHRCSVLVRDRLAASTRTATRHAAGRRRPRRAGAEYGGGRSRSTSYTVVPGDSDDGPGYGVAEGTDVVVLDCRITPDRRRATPRIPGLRRPILVRPVARRRAHLVRRTASNPTTIPSGDLECSAATSAAVRRSTGRPVFVVPAGGAEDGAVSDHDVGIEFREFCSLH